MAVGRGSVSLPSIERQRALTLVADNSDGGVMVRLWVDGEDYGTMSERAAEMYKEENARIAPEEVVWTEPVADDAPTFLLREPK